MQTAPLRALIALVLVVLTAVGSGCRAQPRATGSGGGDRSAPLAANRASRLQEVAPPGTVAALNERLAERTPRVEIVAPADDALLPDGPWTLQLRVSDWPLSDAPGLGLGPHLVVQLDQQPALTISSPEAAAAVTMPPLQPGSHRLTVYAARPWGEAVKSTGALRQIRLHRVSRNTAELPPRGSAQLIVASPAQPEQQEPVLLDWLLLDAPLQHLSSDDARWRLRVSLNGDSVLVDRQTPLWLTGFRPGSNALQLELLDGRGEPLNPPFNSLVREVVIGGGDRPAWRRPSLTPAELAQLSGEPPAAAAPQTANTEADTPAPAPTADPTEPPATAAPDKALAAEPPAQENPEPVAPPAGDPEQAPDAAGTDPQPAAEAREAAPMAPPPSQTSAGAEASSAAPSPSAAASTQASGTEAGQTVPSAGSADEASASASATPATEPSPARPPAPSARDQVNADGSLLRSKPRGPLAGLREKLGG